MHGGDDDLERRLRAMFRAHQLNIADDDLLGRVHAGARRRQHRRVAASGAAVVAVVAIAGTAFALRPHPGPAVTADNHHPVTSTAPPPSSAAPPSSASPSPSFAGKPPVPSTLLPSPSASEPAKFNPVSVSAVSVDDYWVLGYVGGGAVIMHTTDGGQHFDRTGSPPVLVAQAPIRRPAGSPTISDIRFGDARHGWAYGKSLYETDDAGSTWRRLTTLPGDVVDLAAANGKVWAIVDVSGGEPTAAPGNHYALYSATYGDGPAPWAQVQLPIDLGDVAPALADQDGVVTITAQGPLRASDGFLAHALVSSDGTRFSDHVLPCPQVGRLGLSVTAKTVWATCGYGHSTAVFESTNHGVKWEEANIGGPIVYTLGAVDASRAVVDTSRGLELASTDGTYTSLVPSSDQPGGYAAAPFIGFTTPKVGFAIVDRQGASSQLWRTTDDGNHWSALVFPQP
jgi:photosystem II stability/assembly factor-like uncharacterized protein